MNITVTIANPAGNITAIVEGVTDRNKYQEISSALFEMTEEKIEQVGFVREPILGQGAISRLEMAGLEFCANATRSFALYTAVKKGLPKGSIPVEISGMDEVLICEVDPKEMTGAVTIHSSLHIKYTFIDGVPFPAVLMDGITHFLAFDQGPDEDLNELLIAKAKEDHNPPAVGVMYLDALTGMMTPYVRVLATNTSYYEGSCGSGTIALAMHQAEGSPEDHWSSSVLQPGGSIQAKAVKQDEIFTVTIDGPITLKEISIQI